MQGIEEDEDIALQVSTGICQVSYCANRCSLLDPTSLPAESLSEEPEAASSQSHTHHACIA